MSSENNSESRGQRQSIAKQLGERFRKHRASVEEGGNVASTREELGERTVIATVEELGLVPRKPVPVHAVSEVRALPLVDVVDSPYQPRKRALTRRDVADLMGTIAAV